MTDCIPKILFIDDEAAVLDGIRRMLVRQQQDWELHFASGALAGLELARRVCADLIVTDVNMPGIDGLELLKMLADDPELATVPAIVLTGNGQSDIKRRALEAGALDLLNKPVTQEDLVARIQSALRLREYELRICTQNQELERRVRERTAELESSRLETIWRLAQACEYRDEDTGQHVVRVGHCARVIAEDIGLGPDYIEKIFHASPLHDIGKIAVPDSVLLKPGKLDASERALIEKHCEIGHAMLSGRIETVRGLQKANPLLEMAATIAHTHHEKWDGSGYPRGLIGDEIPLCGRVVAAADVLDALSHARPYKPAMPFAEAIRVIQEGSGGHFDPSIVQAVMNRRCELEIVMREQGIRWSPLRPAG